MLCVQMDKIGDEEVYAKPRSDLRKLSYGGLLTLFISCFLATLSMLCCELEFCSVYSGRYSGISGQGTSEERPQYEESLHKGHYSRH